MEVVFINHPHTFLREQLPELVMALGYFDGVHLGHQQVIKQAKQKALELGLKSAVMTFDPHPSVVLRKSSQHVEYITPLEEKIRLIGELEIDYCFIVRFTPEFANLVPQEFVDQYIIGLNVQHVVAGFDYSYGKLGKGTMETLPFHSRDQFTFSVVPKLTHGYEKVSSTLIRSCIKEGDFSQLPDLLGRFYQVSGMVIHGDKRGRTIGFPTANVDVQDPFLFPPLGVYAVKINVNGKWYQGVCNVGYKPTFHQEQAARPSIEVHIFHFNEDIYGQFVTVEWHLYLRNERKFTGIDELVKQIETDKQNAISYFQKMMN